MASDKWDETELVPPLLACARAQGRARVFAIQFRDETGADLGRTDRFAFISVGAIAEAFGVHHVHHFQNAHDAFGISLGQQRQM